MDKIMHFKSCSIELKKNILYDHNNSKKHKGFENCFLIKITTLREYCKIEKEHDEWREHIISEKHLDLEEKNICENCQMKHNPKLKATNTYITSKFDIGAWQ